MAIVTVTDNETPRLTEIFLSMEAPLRRFIRARVPSDACDDIVSDVWHAAVVAGRAGTVVTGGWLIQVARNKVVDHWRRVERSGRLVTRLAARSDDASHARDAELGMMLDTLRPKDRSLLVRRYYVGLKVKDIASQDGVSVRATESALCRARAALRGHLVDTEAEATQMARELAQNERQ